MDNGFGGIVPIIYEIKDKKGSPDTTLVLSDAELKALQGDRVQTILGLSILNTLGTQLNFLTDSFSAAGRDYRGFDGSQSGSSGCGGGSCGGSGRTFYSPVGDRELDYLTESMGMHLKRDGLIISIEPMDLRLKRRLERAIDNIRGLEINSKTPDLDMIRNCSNGASNGSSGCGGSSSGGSSGPGCGGGQGGGI